MRLNIRQAGATNITARQQLNNGSTPIGDALQGLGGTLGSVGSMLGGKATSKKDASDRLALREAGLKLKVRLSETSTISQDETTSGDDLRTIAKDGARMDIEAISGELPEHLRERFEQDSLGQTSRLEVAMGGVARERDIQANIDTFTSGTEILAATIVADSAEDKNGITLALAGVDSAVEDLGETIDLPVAMKESMITDTKKGIVERVIQTSATESAAHARYAREIVENDDIASMFSPNEKAEMLEYLDKVDSAWLANGNAIGESYLGKGMQAIENNVEIGEESIRATRRKMRVDGVPEEKIEEVSVALNRANEINMTVRELSAIPVGDIDRMRLDLMMQLSRMQEDLPIGATSAALDDANVTLEAIEKMSKMKADDPHKFAHTYNEAIRIAADETLDARQVASGGGLDAEQQKQADVDLQDRVNAEHSVIVEQATKSTGISTGIPLFSASEVAEYKKVSENGTVDEVLSVMEKYVGQGNSFPNEVFRSIYPDAKEASVHMQIYSMVSRGNGDAKVALTAVRNIDENRKNTDGFNPISVSRSGSADSLANSLRQAMPAGHEYISTGDKLIEAMAMQYRAGGMTEEESIGKAEQAVYGDMMVLGGDKTNWFTDVFTDSDYSTALVIPKSELNQYANDNNVLPQERENSGYALEVTQGYVNTPMFKEFVLAMYGPQSLGDTDNEGFLLDEIKIVNVDGGYQMHSLNDMPRPISMEDGTPITFSLKMLLDAGREAGVDGVSRMPSAVGMSVERFSMSDVYRDRRTALNDSNSFVPAMMNSILLPPIDAN